MTTATRLVLLGAMNLGRVGVCAAASSREVGSRALDRLADHDAAIAVIPLASRHLRALRPRPSQ